MIKAGLISLVFLSLANVAGASAPDTSLRPVARGDAVAAEAAQSVAQVRPRARAQKQSIEAAITAALVPEPAHLSQVVVKAMARSLRPVARPQGLLKRVSVARAPVKGGALCGDPDLVGEVVGRVPAKLSGCGMPDGVRVRAISGVRLSQPALVRCETAKALKTWLERDAKPAIGRRGGGLAELKVAAHYSCRTRNNLPGAKISEHGKGRAIDISAFRLNNGDAISVLKDWGNGRDGRILKKMHKAACGTFGTVLGPESDRFHKDHFHFDTARHGNGAYCR